MALQDSKVENFRVIDSHIHLYAKSHISALNWTADLPDDHLLNRQNSVQEYKSVSQGHPGLLGFIFLETDRKSGLRSTEWENPLKEVEFLLRIATGTPLQDEGHLPEDMKLVLGIVPWAPVPAGTTLLAEYVQKVQTRFSIAKLPHLFKGVRYLVQDKPAGTMLEPSFIDGLQWLGKQGLGFDLGIDSHRGSINQLEEACEMLHQVYASGSEVKIMINHFCKPDLRLSALQACGGHPDFVRWKVNVEKMASYSLTYMKLSGFFPELPPQDEDHPADISSLVEQTKPWIDVVFQCFTPHRILFGSDWPVCGLGGPGKKSWHHWHDLVAAILDAQHLSPEEKQEVWAGTAARAYNI